MSENNPGNGENESNNTENVSTSDAQAGSDAGNGGTNGGNNAGDTNVENIENIERVEITAKSMAGYMQYLPHMVIGTIAVAVLLGIIYLLFSRGDVNSFISGDTLATRGLITFLVAVVTITIAMILTLSAVLSNSDDFKERFALGKEILTILIGVLGTIVGFYFGADRTITSNVPPDAAAAAQQLQIIPLNLSSDQVTSQTGTIITVGISGGKSPYKYKIIFDTPVLQTIEGDAPNGVIQAQVSKPAAGFDKDTEVGYSIEAVDAENRKTVLTGDKVKKFVVKNQ